MGRVWYYEESDDGGAEGFLDKVSIQETMKTEIKFEPNPLHFYRMDNDFANFDELVRSQHEEMDRQV